MPLFKKEIKKFNSWLVLIILVLFLIIIDMIIFIKARNESEALISLIENSDNELNKSLDSYVTGIANDINRINNLDPSKWEIYQNKQYGIAFRYPQYLKKNEYPGSNENNQPLYVLNLSAYSDNFISRIYLMIFDSSLEKAIGEASSSLENVQKKEINISGNPGIKLSGNTSDRVLSKNSNQAAVIGIQKENLVYLITSEDNEVLKKLVSTIKFE